MRTETIKIFKIDELSDKAREKAIEDWRNWEDHIDLSAWEESWKEKLENEYGFKNPVLRYSLGYSQGDGASFTWDATPLGKLNLLKVWKTINVTMIALNNHDGLSQECRKSVYSMINRDMRLGSYNSSDRRCNTRSVYAAIKTSGWYMASDTEFAIAEKMLNVMACRIDKVATQAVKAIAEEITYSGYAEIEYQKDSDVILETLRANDYEFLEDGSFYG